MPNYSVTIGYKAVININVNADSEKEAKEHALAIMKRREEVMFKHKSIDLNDSNYAAHGIVDMDATWNMVQS